MAPARVKSPRAPRTTIGRYRILGEIGRGAMGVVYRAHDPRLDRVVAIKTIRKERYTGDEAQAHALGRFEREAKAAGKLSHPGIVTVYDVEEDGDDLYIAMEFVEGASLRARMNESGRFPVADAVGIVLQVCDALGYAHARGVIHRDVKPDNILCLADGTLKLADFGIARLATATATHTAMGTPRYMAPEQWRGAPVDGRTDLFAVGVILHELLTGSTPFPAARNHNELMYAILNDEPQVPSQVDPTLPKEADAIVRRALSRDPSGRYATAREMAEAVERLARTRESAPTPSEPVRLTILRRGDVHFVDLAETGTLIPRSETRVEAAFMQDIAGEVERVAAATAANADTGTRSGTMLPSETGAGTGMAETVLPDRVSELQAIGRLIYSHLLTQPARQKIAAHDSADLYLRLDEQLVHVPWELCYDGTDFLATKFRVGRQVITDRQLPRRETGAAPRGDTLKLLLVTDPTETLRGAAEESRAIESQLAAVSGVHVTRLVGTGVRKVQLLQALGRSHIVHFAGHSVYDADDPTRSGWVLSDGILTAGEMTKLDRLPELVFSNSCHAGATVGWDGRSRYEGHAFGIGSAFLLAGVPNYVGTFWVAHDDESALFARAFYQALLRGQSTGQALHAARKRILDQCGWNQLTWASYMLYGDPAYRLPIRRSAEGAARAVPAGAGAAGGAVGVFARPDVTEGQRPRMGRAQVRWLAGAAAVVALAGAVWLMRPEPREELAPPEVPVARAREEPAAPEETEPEIPVTYRAQLGLVQDPAVAQDLKLLLLDGLTDDRGEWGTKVLIELSKDADRLVSMKSIRGLSGRACPVTQDALTALIDDPEPYRRAWAAKVLGDTGCRAALDALVKRLAIEGSDLVRPNLKASIKRLAPEATG